MNKKDVEIAINEIKRVMIDDGLCYINFLSKEDFRYGQGEEEMCIRDRCYEGIRQ